MNILNSPKGIAKNPLGILSLLISLIYGIACLVFSLGAKNLSENEKIPLIYFIVIFPFVILFTLYALVKNHHNKLYAPSDFQNEENFINAFKQVAKSEDYIDKAAKPISYRSSNSTDVLADVKDELRKRQTDLFETLKIVSFFLYRHKNEAINQAVLSTLSDEAIAMLKFQEKNLLKSNTINEEDRLFK
jgi:D-alanyl-lipoteichoic acid acyltransferase DltB (MBOAT superfamily)